MLEVRMHVGVIGAPREFEWEIRRYARENASFALTVHGGAPGTEFVVEKRARRWLVLTSGVESNCPSIDAVVGCALNHLKVARGVKESPFFVLEV